MLDAVARAIGRDRKWRAELKELFGLLTPRAREIMACVTTSGGSGGPAQ